MYDVVIIGGGASGLYCAINIDINKKVAIIDTADRLGKKILVTGNGRCNITNVNVDVSKYNTPLVDKYFAKYSNKDLINDFATMGICTYSDEEGRVYPSSNSANSVLDVLLEQVTNRNNIQVFLSTKVEEIKECDSGYVVSTNNGVFETAKLVFATGGNSGTKYLEMLNVRYNGFVPSLVALKTDKNKGLGGVRISGVRVKYNGFDEVGEVLFKEDGISGIVIFNLSAYFARNNLYNGVINIDLLPNIDEDNLRSFINNCIKNNPDYSPILLLEGLLHKAVARNIIDRLNIAVSSIDKLTKIHVNAIIKCIKNYTVKVIGVSDNNQVHSGGVPIKDLNNNLEHMAHKNLYFVGEIVDVDGVCGGYNLQWAWTSGKIVGESL